MTSSKLIQTGPLSSMITILADLRIPISEFDLTYVRSSGPGGQNVNKVNSKAVLRWNLFSSSSLSLEVRNRLFQKLQNQLTAEGDLVISSDRFRDQTRNREDCFEKFQALLTAAAHRAKKRKKTKPSYSSVQRVKKAKKHHSNKKSLRKVSRHEE